MVSDMAERSVRKGHFVRTQDGEETPDRDPAIGLDGARIVLKRLAFDWNGQAIEQMSLE